jgi:hypothetical protein
MASDFEAEPNTLDQHLEKAQKAAEGLVNGLSAPAGPSVTKACRISARG